MRLDAPVHLVLSDGRTDVAHESREVTHHDSALYERWLIHLPYTWSLSHCLLVRISRSLRMCEKNGDHLGPLCESIGDFYCPRGSRLWSGNKTNCLELTETVPSYIMSIATSLECVSLRPWLCVKKTAAATFCKCLVFYFTLTTPETFAKCLRFSAILWMFWRTPVNTWAG